MKNVLTEIKKPKIYGSIIIHALLICLLGVVLYPFAVALTGSFKTTPEMLTSPKLLPNEWKFDNYVIAWVKANFAVFTWNSLWYTICIVIVTVLTSSLTGYVFARGRFRGKKLIFAMFSSLMFVTLGSSSLYPTMQLMKMFHLNESLMGLVIKSFFAINVADMYIVRGFVNSLPKELDEAAKIDGCSFIGTFFKVILPLLKPVLATVAILSFSAGWNDYLWPMIVTMGNPNAQPLSVGLRALQNSGSAAAAWNLVLAGSMISAVPMTIIYIFFNKYFIKGIAAGAVKG